MEEHQHHRGRTLDVTRDAALRDAALELLAEIGYDRLTIDAVAARARAGKTTLYRRWSGKAELIVDALACVKGPAAVPDTGSLRGDLVALAGRLGATDGRFKAKVTVGLVTALAHDAELRAVFRDRFLGSDATGIERVLRQAADRGEIPGDRRFDLLASLLPALALHHLLMTGEMPTVHLARRVIDEIVLPLATGTLPPSAPSPPPEPSRAAASRRPAARRS